MVTVGLRKAVPSFPPWSPLVADCADARSSGNWWVELHWVPPMADRQQHPRQVWKVTSGTESLRIGFSPGQHQRPPTVSLGSVYQAPSRICWLLFSTTSSLVQPTVEFCKGCRSSSCPSWWQWLLPCLHGIKFLSRTWASAMVCVYQCQELTVEPGQR